MNEWIDGSAASLLSYFFTERPFRWRTSYLSSEQPLFRAISSLTLLWGSQLPILYSSSCNRIFSSRRRYTAFSNLQLQSRIRSVPASCMLCCAQRCRRLLSQPLASLHSRSITTNRPTAAQHQQCESCCATLCCFLGEATTRYSRISLFSAAEISSRHGSGSVSDFVSHYFYCSVSH